MIIHPRVLYLGCTFSHVLPRFACFLGRHPETSCCSDCPPVRTRVKGHASITTDQQYCEKQHPRGLEPPLLRTFGRGLEGRSARRHLERSALGRGAWRVARRLSVGEATSPPDSRMAGGYELPSIPFWENAAIAQAAFNSWQRSGASAERSFAAKWSAHG